MEEFRLELNELDDSQERVEAASGVLLRQRGEDGLAQEMVKLWVDSLRSSDFQSERLAFLYVANHVIQTMMDEAGNEELPAFVKKLMGHLEEAVALVSNSPLDRDGVLRLLRVWHEKEICPSADITRMWESTGEALPDFLRASDGRQQSSGNQEANEDEDTTLPLALPGVSDPSAPALKRKRSDGGVGLLNSSSASPLLDALKQIDRYRQTIGFVEEQLKTNHSYVLEHAAKRYQKAEDVLQDGPASMKKRVGDCLTLVKIRNRYLADVAALEHQVKHAIQAVMKEEKSAESKVEQKLEQCDMIDIGLADLVEHRAAHPEEWSAEAEKCSERLEQREVEKRARSEKLVEQHKKAIADSQAHARDLEKQAPKRRNLSSAAAEEAEEQRKKNPEDTEEEKQQKARQVNDEMVWHPVLRELVPLQSLNVEWETWRDH